jgi:hypothetical protein
VSEFKRGVTEKVKKNIFGFWEWFLCIVGAYVCMSLSCLLACFLSVLFSLVHLICRIG